MVHLPYTLVLLFFAGFEKYILHSTSVRESICHIRERNKNKEESFKNVCNLIKHYKRKFWIQLLNNNFPLFSKKMKMKIN